LTVHKARSDLALHRRRSHAGQRPSRRPWLDADLIAWIRQAFDAAGW